MPPCDLSLQVVSHNSCSKIAKIVVGDLWNRWTFKKKSETKLSTVKPNSAALLLPSVRSTEMISLSCCTVTCSRPVVLNM